MRSEGCQIKIQLEKNDAVNVQIQVALATIGVGSTY